jgi:DNA-binding SARP family transcriptional activator
MVVQMHDTTTRRVELRLLGGFELTIDGKMAELQPAAQRLTAFVALSPRGVDRMFTAFQLWPNTSEQRAKANLRSTLWRLHRLGADVVSATAARLRLSPSVWLDTRDGLPAPDGRAPEALPFQSMLTDLLPDWYDDWLAVERERYRQLRLSDLESRARDAIDAGETGRAIQLALAALAIDGLRESSHRLVIEAHRAEGNHREAERETLRYHRCLADLSSAGSW